MTTTTITQAERILTTVLLGDGCRERTRLGVRRSAYLARVALRRTVIAGSHVEWMLPDGSELHEYDTGLDTPEGWAANA